MIHGTRITTFCIAIFLSLYLAASAEQVTDLNIFENGTAADANEVNSNFSKLQQAVNTNDLKDGGTMNGPLTVPAMTYSSPRSASVTYSAMGFAPGKGEAVKQTIGIYNLVNNYATEFEKRVDEGSLAILNDDSGAFYHSVSLRSGVTITRIRAHVRGVVTVNLKKRGDADPLAAATSTGEGDQIIQDDTIDHVIEEFPASYYIEVLLSEDEQRLYSVAIDYTYTEP